MLYLNSVMKSTNKEYQKHKRIENRDTDLRSSLTNTVCLLCLHGRGRIILLERMLQNTELWRL